MALNPFKCRSMGLVPIAQPPGREIRARPNRDSRGPKTKKEARMRRTGPYGAVDVLRRPAFIKTRSLLRSRKISTPRDFKRIDMVPTSSRSGTSSRITLSEVRSEAAIIGRQAFFAPLILTLPIKGTPPSTSILPKETPPP